MAAVQLAPSDVDPVQETLLGEALEHAPVGAIVLDEHGRYLAANRMACRLTGYERSELLALSPEDLSAEPDVVAHQLRQMEIGVLEHGKARLRRKDGSDLAVEYRVGPTRSGGLPHFVLVFWEAS